MLAGGDRDVHGGLCCWIADIHRAAPVLASGGDIASACASQRRRQCFGMCLSAADDTELRLCHQAAAATCLRPVLVC